MSQKQSCGIITRILNIALPILTCAAAVFYIGYVSSLDVAVEARLNGDVLGYVESFEDVMEAENYVKSVISSATNKTFAPDISVDCNLVHKTAPKYLTAKEFAELIWAKYEDDFCEAYMLYVDDKQIAAHHDKKALEALISDIEFELLASSDFSFEGVEITNRLHITKQLCLKSMLRSIDEINAIVNPLEEPPPESNTNSMVITARISALSVASPETHEDILDSIQASNTADVTIGYNFVDTATFSETIYHTTKYIEDPNTLVGRDKVLTQGSDGERIATYEIFYDAEGNIIRRELIEETIITPVVDTVIKVGARPIPDSVPLGNFIWPCETPKGISSPYGPRVIYGKEEFHLGIDLPDKKGSPIYASDGGTVVWAGQTPSYGNSIRIMHNDGYETLYAHLNTMLVSPGDKVYQGQQIATMGNTGVAYGSHLHFEVRINGKTYDPEDYLPELVIPNQ